MYINLWQNFRGHPDNVKCIFFGCKFLKILLVSDKTIPKVFRIHKTL